MKAEKCIDRVERTTVPVNVMVTRQELERLRSIGPDWRTVLSVRATMAGQDLAEEVEQGQVLGIDDRME